MAGKHNRRAGKARRPIAKSSHWWKAVWDRRFLGKLVAVLAVLCLLAALWATIRKDHHSEALAPIAVAASVGSPADRDQRAEEVEALKQQINRGTALVAQGNPQEA